MRLEIVSKKENPLLERQEVTFVVKESNTIPSRKEIREKIAAMTNSDEKKVSVGVLETHFGTSEAKGEARIYKDEKNLHRVELSYVAARNFGKIEKKKEAPKQEEPAPPAPEKKK